MEGHPTKKGVLFALPSLFPWLVVVMVPGAEIHDSILDGNQFTDKQTEAQQVPNETRKKRGRIPRREQKSDNRSSQNEHTARSAEGRRVPVNINHEIGSLGITHRDLHDSIQYKGIYTVDS